MENNTTAHVCVLVSGGGHLLLGAPLWFPALALAWPLTARRAATLHTRR